MNRRVIILIGFLLQMFAVLAVFVPPMMLRATGTRAALLTVPVDPRSLLRGDYVVLDYVAGQGLPMDWNGYGNAYTYVVLEKKGETYERVRFSLELPALEEGQICLRGRPDYRRVTFTDIAQYFVPEGEGRELEQARNTRRLFVDIAADSACRAVTLGVRLGPEAPLEVDVEEGMMPPIMEPMKRL